LKIGNPEPDQKHKKTLGDQGRGRREKRVVRSRRHKSEAFGEEGGKRKFTRISPWRALVLRENSGKGRRPGKKGKRGNLIFNLRDEKGGALRKVEYEKKGATPQATSPRNSFGDEIKSILRKKLRSATLKRVLNKGRGRDVKARIF